MNKTKTKINIVNTRRLNSLLIFAVIFSLFVYLHSYQSSISHATTIEFMQDKISNLKSEISEVEFQTVEVKRAIDKEVAINDGFVSVDEIIFIKKNAKTALNAVTN